ncbi:MAG: amino acid--[acyl-carrier-protein] ligase [Polyangia bacterium]
MLNTDDDAQRKYLDALIGKGHLIATGEPGVFGRGRDFERVVNAVDDAVTRLGANDPDVDVWRFPPVVTRKTFEKSGYMGSFPTLAGVVHSFVGGEREQMKLLGEVEGGGDWSKSFPATHVCLTPAACYPVYPAVAAAGPLGPNGRTVDVQSYCFRHEPSDDPARMQMFRQREHVRIGTPEVVQEFRQRWLERGVQLMNKDLQLPGGPDIANDPFFGRGGKILAQNQRENALKFEILIPITSTEKPTACVSFNYHQDHFGHLFGIKQADGSEAHTACFGFGLERCTLALFMHHGLDLAGWPTSVSERLAL